ncbi:MAG TPA: hypothetical protein GYA07_14260 [Verrucomicrobia bacterium]|nr:hypothetical protein [Verrucomicrobiota bacterium]HOB33988.1 hypothetical protein [Verrucomicrobiota bacterium]HOP98108.1 hypothetical protein [Verrucomicrobiota bacterium]HPU57080.1 hypothetical protein [Verrucomicrobiota bacterium]
MKQNLLFGIVLLAAGSLMAAESVKDEVAAAAKKLAEKENYSWTSQLDLGPDSPFTPGPTQGKTQKDGLIWISSSFGDNTTEGLMKGSKIAVKTDGGWQSADPSDAGQGGFDPAAFMARRMQSTKAPAAEVEDLLARASEVKKEGDAYVATLNEEGARALASFGRGRRGGQPNMSGTKATVKFWIKDGVLSKYETRVTGKLTTPDGEEREFNRTTTVEIKDVGTTKLDVPEEARSKVS